MSENLCPYALYHSAYSKEKDAVECGRGLVERGVGVEETSAGYPQQLKFERKKEEHICLKQNWVGGKT